jgi:Xaa-Pro aminopeptidase
VTRESLELAIEKARPGNRLFDICGTVERHVTANGFTVVREFVGHGIGTRCTRSRRSRITWTGKNENPRLKEGMVLAIEPMVNAGKPGQPGQGRTVDRGDRGRQVLGAFRAYGGGDGERTVGADAAVTEARAISRGPARKRLLWSCLPSAGYR